MALKTWLRDFIMRKQNTLIKNNDKLESFSEFNVVGDFRVNNHNYMIIEQMNNLETLIESRSFAFLPLVVNSQIACFEIDGLALEIILVNNPAGLDSHVTGLLTKRELQIANLVALGHCNKQIASKLKISEWTVSTHLRRVFAKLGVDSRAAMVYRCASVLQ